MAGNGLTDAALRNLKPTGKPYKKFDKNGLFILVTEKGSLLWRMKFTRVDGKPDTLTFGKYPDVSLKEARAKCEEARKLIRDGINPKEKRKQEEAELKAKELEKTNTFEHVAREWWERQTGNNKPKHRQQQIGRLEKHVFPYIGNIPISQLKFADYLDVVHKVEEFSNSELPKRIAQLIQQVCQYAFWREYTKGDYAAHLTKALKPAAKPKPMAYIDNSDDLGKFLIKVDQYQYRATPGMACALWLVPRLFLRSNEICGAEWAEIDFQNALWTLPAERMKMDRPHTVPLARQVIEKLEFLRRINTGKYLFPSGGKKGYISGEGLRKTLVNMGYAKEDLTIHGFRHTASTFLTNAKIFRAEVIEKQMAHESQAKARAIYNHADYMEERRELMQWWADYLDGLRNKALSENQLLSCMK